MMVLLVTPIITYHKHLSFSKIFLAGIVQPSVPCIDEGNANMESWSCSFELDDGMLTWCDLVQVEGEDEFDWTIGEGSTPSGETGPDFANTPPYYIYIEASNPRERGDRAK